MSVASTTTGARLVDRGWFPVAFHAAAIALVLVSRIVWQDPSRTLIFGGAIMGLTCVGLGVMETRRAPLRLSPLSMYFFWYAVGLGLSAMHYGQQIADSKPIGFYGKTVEPDDVADGYIIYLIGSLVLHAGVQMVRPYERQVRSINQRLDKTVPFLVFVWAVGVLLAWRSDLVAATGALAPLATGAPLAALSCFALVDRRQLRLGPNVYYFALICGTAGLVAASVNAGSKAAIMFSLMPLAWHVVLRVPGARWYLPIGLLAFAGLYFFVVGPLVTVARATAAQEGEVGASGVRLLRTIDDIRTGRSDLNGADEGYARLANFLERQFDPLPVGFIAGDVAENGLYMGANMDYAAYAFIPRFIWPDKPAVTRGLWFAVYLGAATSESTSTISIGETATGELYWNFGWLGMIAGMFAIGGLVGLLWRLAGAEPQYSFLRMLLYITLTITMVSMAEAVSVVASLVAIALAFFAATAGIRLAGYCVAYVKVPAHP